VLLQRHVDRNRFIIYSIVRTFFSVRKPLLKERKIETMNHLPSWWVWIPRLVAVPLPIGFMLIALIHKDRLSFNEIELLLLLALPFSFAFWWGVRLIFVAVDKQIGQISGLCANCGYDLHGATGPCPECGKPATNK
jgi:hypothetical protein